MTEEVKDNIEVVVSDAPPAPVEPEIAEQEEQANSSGEAKEGEADQDEGQSEEQGEEQESGDDETANPKGKANGVQKRINKAVKQREEAKREAERLRKELDELKGNANKEPVESDFETYDQYLDALDKYDNSNSDPEGDEKPDQKGEAEELSDSQKTAMAVLSEAFESSDKPEDFEEVAFADDLQVTADMLEALAECDDPSKVLYHLGKNKDLAAEIAGKGPKQQLKELLKLDMTSKDFKPAKPVKITKTADPIDPVGGADAQEKSISEMSFAEYEAHMNKKDRGY